MEAVEKFRFVKSQTLKLTKNLAETFASMTPAPGDRVLSESRITKYISLVNAGRFRKDSDWCRCHCKETGLTYRTNGKHTSTMFTRIDIPTGQEVTIKDYEADSLEGVAELYATHDAKENARTSSNIYVNYAKSFPELHDVKAKAINLTISGLSFHLWLEQYGMKPAIERATLLHDQTSFCLFLNDLLQGDNSKPLRKLSVAAAMFGCFKKSQKSCQEFWTAVRDETGPTPDLPDRKLGRFLVECSVRSSGINPVSRKIITQKELYVKCIHGWNAWRSGEKTDLKYYAGKNIPAFK